MAQHDYVIANGTGAAVRSDLNNGLSAIVTQNSGATEPATTYAFMRWADTTAGVMKMRNSANNAWITLYQLDGEWTNIAFENGTAAAPSIYFKDSGTDTGFYSPGANQVGISTGGTARLTIDSNGNVDIDSNTLYVDATNNRVGLGTSSPSLQLTLNSSDTTGTGVRLENTSSGGYNWSIFSIGSAASLAPVGCLAFRDATNAATRLVIDPIGRVGIGVTSPGSLLHVEGGQIYANRNGAGTQQVLQLNNSDTTAGTQVVKLAFGSSGTTKASINAAVYGNDYLTFNTGSDTERARIDSSGRLLVGTSSSRGNFLNTTGLDPRVQIEGTDGLGCIYSAIGNFNGAGGEAQLFLSKSRGTTIGSNTIVQNGDGIGAIQFQGSDGSEFVQAAEIKAFVDGTPGANDMPGRLVFSTTADGASSPTERMRITSAGNLFFGTTTKNITSPNNPGFEIHVQNTGGLGLYSSTTNNNITSVVFQNPNGRVGFIDINANSVAYSTTSDYRLKENVVPLTGAIDRINQLPVHRFNFTGSPNTTMDGFLAHEAQAVVPEAVTGEKDAVDDDGNPVYQGIDQSKLVPLLTAALQEALAEIESLKARVTALEP
jgi:hypothetical protein